MTAECRRIVIKRGRISHLLESSPSSIICDIPLIQPRGTIVHSGGHGLRLSCHIAYWGLLHLPVACLGHVFNIILFRSVTAFPLEGILGSTVCCTVEYLGMLNHFEHAVFV